MEQSKENKMGVMPVNKLLFSMALPIMISMLVQALYNIVDSIFVAQYSQNALTAVSLAFPVQNLMIAVGVGTAVGLNSMLSRRLGERRYEDANIIAENGVFLAILTWLAFALFGIVFSRVFFKMFTEIEEVIEMGQEYMFICCVFSIGVFMQVMFERIMQATGNSVYSMIIQTVGAVINIILDPIFIFGKFGLPEMGIAGAAIATVIGQIAAMLLGIFLTAVKIKEVRLNFRKFKPSLRAIKEIYIIGVPSIIMQSIASVMTVGINKILVSEVAVSVFGVYFKLQSFVFMPVFGITNALIPIVAFNYGAAKKSRMISTIKLAAVSAMSIMFLGTIIFQLFPQYLLGFFEATQEMLEIGIPALRIISICFIFAGLCIVLSSVFQALGNGFLSMIMSITRQLIVLLPAAYILKKFVGRDAIWFAFSISEIVCTVMCLFMFRWVYDKYIKNIPE